MRFALALALALVLGPVLANCSDAADDREKAGTLPPSSSSPVDVIDGVDDMATRIPVALFEGDQTDRPAPYFGSQNTSGGAAEPAEGFEPDAADQEFCWAVAVINSRPQPRDEFEEVVVAEQYFEALRPFVPSVLADEWSLLLEFTGTVVEAGAFTEVEENTAGALVGPAVQTINDFVDRQCLGVP